MSDIASLVLGVPGYVEGFIKLGRAVKKMQSLEKDHKEVIEDAIFCAGTLDYYAGFLDIKDPRVLQHPSRPLLEEALVHAYDALNMATCTLDGWKSRLGLNDERQKVMKFEKLRLLIVQKVTRSMSNKREPEPVRNYSSSKLLTKAAYLAFGVVEIEDAMARLNKWTTRFGQLLLTSPSLRLHKRPDDASGRRKEAEDIAFVARARNHLTSEREVLVIDFEQLSSMFDIDVEHKSRIYRLEDGDYAGYIVDVRDPFINDTGDGFDEEEADTLRICRLAAEVPSDREFGARASVGILPCAGYAIRESPAAHCLLFRLPPGIGSPCTLRTLLLCGSARHFLNSRLEFCIKLVTSVFIVHSLGIVHKNIRPDSILVANDLRTDRAEERIGTPYLLGFGQARLDADPSGLRPYKGEIYARTLYVHPRHMSGMRTNWRMRDDIYSLGICLFEIAIWRSLLIWDPDEGGLVGDFEFLPLSDEHYDKVLNKRGKPIHEDRIWMRYNDIIKYASELIPTTMGETFRDVVLRCLRFGDTDKEDENKDKGEDEDSEKTELSSVMFMEDVLTKLRNLVFTF